MYRVSCQQEPATPSGTRSCFLQATHTVKLLQFLFYYSSVLLAFFLSSMPLHISSPLLLFTRLFYTLTICFHFIFLFILSIRYLFLRRQQTDEIKIIRVFLKFLKQITDFQENCYEICVRRENYKTHFSSSNNQQEADCDNAKLSGCTTPGKRVWSPEQMKKHVEFCRALLL